LGQRGTRRLRDLTRLNRRQSNGKGGVRVKTSVRMVVAPTTG